MRTKFFFKNFLIITIGCFAIDFCIYYFYFNKASLFESLITSVVTGLMLSLAFTYANGYRLKQ